MMRLRHIVLRVILAKLPHYEVLFLTFCGFNSPFLFRIAEMKKFAFSRKSQTKMQGFHHAVIAYTVFLFKAKSEGLSFPNLSLAAVLCGFYFLYIYNAPYFVLVAFTCIKF